MSKIHIHNYYATKENIKKSNLQTLLHKPHKPLRIQFGFNTTNLFLKNGLKLILSFLLLIVFLKIIYDSPFHRNILIYLYTMFVGDCITRHYCSETEEKGVIDYV